PAPGRRPGGGPPPDPRPQGGGPPPGGEGLEELPQAPGGGGGSFRDDALVAARLAEPVQIVRRHPLDGDLARFGRLQELLPSAAPPALGHEKAVDGPARTEHLQHRLAPLHPAEAGSFPPGVSALYRLASLRIHRAPSRVSST